MSRLYIFLVFSVLLHTSLGAIPVPDPTNPNWDPLDEESAVSTSLSQISISFDVDIDLDTSAGGSVKLFDVTNGLLVTSTPTSDTSDLTTAHGHSTLDWTIGSSTLSANTAYAVEIPPNYIFGRGTDPEDYYAGFSDNSTWNFNTFPTPTFEPGASSPRDDSSDVSVSQTALRLGFSANIGLHPDTTTRVRLEDSGGTVNSWATNDPEVSVSGSKLVISLASTTLQELTTYHVTIDNSFVVIDGTLGAYPGHSDSSTYSFTTTLAPPAIDTTDSNYSPGNGTDTFTPVSITELKLPFDEAIAVNDGYARLYDATNGNTLVASWRIHTTSLNVSIGTGDGAEASVLVLARDSFWFLQSTRYYVTIDAGAIGSSSNSSHTYEGHSADNVWTFTTALGTPAIKPNDLAWYPRNATVSVARNTLTELELPFDTPIALDTSSSAQIQLVATATSTVVKTFTVDATHEGVSIGSSDLVDATLRLNVTDVLPLDQGAVYHVTIPGTAIANRDSATTFFAGITNPNAWSFQMAYSVPVAQPASASPADGAVSVSVNQAALYIDFDVPVELNNGSSATIRFLRTSVGDVKTWTIDGTQTDADVKITNGGTRLELYIDEALPLQQGHDHHVRLPDNVVYNRGNSSVLFSGWSDATTWNFQVEYLPPTPAFSSAVPADDARTVSRTIPQLRLPFDANIQLIPTATGRVRLIDDDAAGAVAAYWDLEGAPANVSAAGNELRLNFTTVSLLEYGHDYHVTIDAGMLAHAENASRVFSGVASSTEWSFQTEFEAPLLLPNDGNFAPHDGQATIDPTTLSTLKLPFTLAIALNTNTNADLQLLDTDNGNAVVKSWNFQSSTAGASVGDGSITNNVLELDISDVLPLEYGNDYHVVVPANVVGNALDVDTGFAGFTDATTWNFQTAYRVPAVDASDSNFAPADDATLVSRTIGTLRISFDVAIDLHEAAGASIYLHDGDNSGAVVKSWTVNGTQTDIAVENGDITGNVLALDINDISPLPYGRDFYVTIESGAIGNARNTSTVFPGFTDTTSWNFETEYEVPALWAADVNNYPSDDATGVPVDTTTLRIAFTTPIGFNDASSGAITLTDTDGSQVVKTWTIDGGQSGITIENGNLTDNVLRLDISDVSLTQGTNYHVQIANGALGNRDRVLTAFTGITDQTTWNFQSEFSRPVLAPNDPAFEPLDNTITVQPSISAIAIAFDIGVAFDESGGGYIRLMDTEANSVVKAWTIDGTQTDIAIKNGLTTDNVVELDISSVSPLQANGHRYHVIIAQGAIGNGGVGAVTSHFAGITDEFGLNFETAYAGLDVVRRYPYVDQSNVTSTANGFIEIEFEAPVNISGVGGIVFTDLSTIDASTATFNLTAANVTLNGTGNVATVTVGQLRAAVRYHVFVPAGFFVNAANASEPSPRQEWEFTTSFGSHVLSDPTLTPANGTTGVANNTTPLVLKFDERMRPGAGGSVTVYDFSTALTVATFSVDSLTYATDGSVYVPVDPLPSGVMYRVRVPANGLQSQAGQFYPGLAGNHDWTFKMADLTTPQATLLPANGAVNHDDTANTFSITFSEIVEWGSDASLNVTLQELTVPGAAPEHFPLQGGNVVLSGTQLTLTKAAAFDEAKGYVITVPAGYVRSTAGVDFPGISGQNWRFSTSGTPTFNATLSPLDDATAVANARTTLTIDFDQNMQIGSTGSITVVDLSTPGNPPLVLPFSSSNIAVDSGDNTLVTITVPALHDLAQDGDPQPGRAYEVTVNPGVLETQADKPWAGVSGASWSFVTDGTTAPLVTQLRPANGTREVPATRTLFAMNFTENIRGNAGSSFVLFDQSLGTVHETFDALTGITITAAPSNNIVELTLSVALEAGHVYHWEVDSTALESYAGVPFAGFNDSLTWDFFVAGGDGLTIQSLSPPNTDDDVLASVTDLVVTFDEIPHVSAGGGNVTVTNLRDDSQTVFDLATSGNVTIDGFALTVKFLPNLGPGEAYQVEISNGALENRAGVPFVGISTGQWRFTTDAPYEPVTVALTPPHNSVNVSGLTTEITVDFSENMRFTSAGPLVTVTDLSTPGVAARTYQSNAAAVALVRGNTTSDVLRVVVPPLHDFGATGTNRTGRAFRVDVASGFVETFLGQGNAAIPGSSWYLTTEGILDVEITAVAPLDDKDDVDHTSLNALTITFSENVQNGDTGDLNVLLYSLESGTVVETVAVASTSIAAAPSNNVVTVPITNSNVGPGHRYAVRVAPAAFKGFAEQDIAGITDPTVWNFATAGTNGPAIASRSPDHLETGVSSTANEIEVCFDLRPYRPQTSKFIHVLNLATDVVESFDTTQPAQVDISCTGSGYTLSCQCARVTLGAVHGSQFGQEIPFEVTIDEGAFVSSQDNSFAGVNATQWRFVSAGTFALSHTLSPSHNDVTVDGNDTLLYIDFNQNVQFDAGTVIVRDLSTPNAPDQSFTFPSASLALVNATYSTSRLEITVNPLDDSTLSGTPKPGRAYHVIIPNTLLKTFADVHYDGQTAGSWYFVTNGRAAPTLETLSPTSGNLSVGVPLNTLVATFSENVVANTGSLQLVSQSDLTSRTFDVTGSDVEIVENVVTITVEEGYITKGKRFYVTIPGTSLKTYADQLYAGIVTDADWTFATGTDGPPGVTLNPADDSTDALSAGSLLQLIFDEAVDAVSGKITLYRESDGYTQEFDTSALDISGKTVTVQGVDTYGEGEPYTVAVPGTMFRNKVGVYLPAIVAPFDWDFVASGVKVFEVLSLTPSDGETEVFTTYDLTIEFNQFVNTHDDGTGDILVVNEATGETLTFPPGHENVTKSDAEVTIHLGGSPLPVASPFYVVVPATRFRSFADVAMTEISATEGWNFVTEGATNPTATLFPLDGQTDVPLVDYINITFSEFVQPGDTSLRINVTSASDSTYEVFAPDDADVVITGNVVRINLAAPLLEGKVYYVDMPADCFRTFAHYPYAGTPGKQAWRFSTTGGSPPTATRSPAHEETDVLVGGQTLTLVFSENIVKENGNIRVLNEKTGDEQLILVSSSDVFVLNRLVRITINPLDTGASYRVLIPGTAFRTLINEYYPGTTFDTWRFITQNPQVPTVSLIPADDSTGIEVGSEAKLVFSEYIKRGTGLIRVRRETDGHEDILDVEDEAQVVIIDNEVRLSHTALLGGAAYFIEIPDTAFSSFADLFFAGYDAHPASPDWNFVMQGVQDLTVLHFVPPPGALVSPTLDTFTIVFSEYVERSSGDLVLVEDVSSGSETIPVGDARVTINGANVTIDPSPLLTGEAYHWEIPGTAFRGFADQYYAGISALDDWDVVTTGATPPQLRVGNQFDPDDDKTNVGSISSISWKFDRKVVTYQNVYVRVIDDSRPSLKREYLCTDTNHVTGNDRDWTLTFEPALEGGHEYHVEIDVGCFRTRSYGVFEGLNDTTTWNFRTSGGTLAAPYLDPDDGSIRSAQEGRTQLRASFDGNLIFKTSLVGDIVFDSDSTEEVENIPVQSSRVWTEGDTVYINFTNPLVANNHYSVAVPSGAFETYNGLLTWGGTDSTEWNFVAFAKGQCGPCPPGESGDGDTCFVCSPGRFSNGSNVCYDCSPGTYAPREALSACFDCAPGTFTAGYQTQECSECPAGKYQTQDGQIECLPCAAGKYSFEDGMSVCHDCEAGTFSAEGASVCTDCPVGQHQDAPGQEQCKNCSLGRHNEVEGAATCTRCPVGRYADQVGLVTCIECPRGKFTDERERQFCTGCPRGRHADVTGLTVCRNCSAGTFASSTGQVHCDKCPPGEAQPLVEQDSCVACPAGFFANASGLAVCVECDSGRFAPSEGSAWCLECPTGRVSVTFQNGTGLSDCVDCSRGKFNSETGRIVCTDCPIGRYADEGGLSECSLCPIGTYQDLEGTTACKDCPSAAVPVEGAIDCLRCPAGEISQYDPGTNTQSCAQCPPGKYADEEGSTACKNCTVGTATASHGSTNCPQCNVGTYEDRRGSSSCKSCTFGKFAVGLGHTECDDCELGKFADQEGSRDCNPCAVGKYADEEGLSQCVDCPEGQFQAYTGKSNCTYCPVGRFSNEVGRDQCLECAIGEWTNRTGTVNCEPCARGKYNPNKGQTKCLDCFFGTYVDSEKATACIKCPVGRYNPSFGKSVCEQCVAGTFQNQEQQTKCKDCSEGLFQPEPGKDACIECRIGFYGTEQGAIECLQCPAGRANSETRRTSCPACPKGTFSQSAGAFFCTECPRGKFADQEESTQCTDCPAGTFQPNTSQSSCIECAAGRSVAVSAQSSCVPCDSGKFTNVTGSSTCEACAKGWFSEKVDDVGPETCTPCAPGRFAANTGSQDCLECETGYFAPNNGTELCSPCPEGTNAPLKGLTACANCTAGRFASTPGSPSCIECEGGTFTPVNGSAFCESCPAGRAAADKGLTLCEPCAVGKFAQGLGAQQCIDCTAGSFAIEEESELCEQCAQGNYSSAGASICTRCEPGRFTDNDGLSECKDCPIGRYMPFYGSPACTPCPKGRYQDETRQTVCKLCARGRAAGDEERTECQDCDTGKYTGDEGTIECYDCPVGRHADEKALTVCKNCTAGRYQNLEGEAVCRACESGQYQPGEAKTACEVCAAGKFSVTENDVGSTGCTDCAIGTEAPQPEQSQCTACPAGKYAEDEGMPDCVNCPRGRYTSSPGQGVCQPCARGFFADTQGRPECLPCPTGEFTALLGSDACTQCFTGRFSDQVNATTCKSCEAGRYTDAVGQVSCKPCDSGSYAADTRQTACDSCERGRFSVKVGDTGQTTCELCAAGSFAGDTGRPACSPCAVGTYADEDGLDVCPSCPEGRYQNEQGKTTCLDCPKGKFANQPGAISCVSCDAGKYADEEGLAQCLECDAGRYSGNGAESCLPCAAGRFADDTGSASCKVCEQGKYSNDEGLTICATCVAGEFQASTEQTSCELCAKGKFTGGVQAVTCTPCEAGKFADQEGTTACSECPRGKFSRADAEVCTDCANGTFADSEGTVNCKVCPRGRFELDTGSLLCEECPAGKFQGEEGRIDCEDCAPGKFSREKGATECTLCAKGTATNEYGRSVCDDCAVGKFVDEEGKEVCVDCAVGKYAGDKGRSECLECDRGRFAPVEGMEVCTRCFEGTYQAEKMATKCDECEPGRYNDELGQQECKACAQGTFLNDTGMSICEDCPQGRANSLFEQTECKECVAPQYTVGTRQALCDDCPPNQYRVAPLDDCLSCPTFGAQCADGVIQALEGFYISFDSSEIATVVECPDGFCLDGSTCGPNRANASDNVLCGRCAEGFWPSGQSCVVCEGYNYPAIALFFVFIWVGVLGLTFVSRPHPMDTAYFQIITYFFQMGLLFLGPVNEWAGWMKVFNLDLASLTASMQGSESECVAQLSPYGNMVMRLAAPVCMCFMLLFIMSYTKLWYKDRWQSWNHIRTMMSVCLFIYVPVTDTILKYLNCIDVGDSLVVADAPAIDCRDPQYQTWGIAVYMTLIFFVIGAPVAIAAFLIYFNRKGRLFDNDFMHRYGVLYDRFKTNRFWWVFVTLVRRTVLVAMAVFERVRGRKFALLSFAQLGFLLMHTHYDPYLLANENLMGFMSLVSLLVLTIAMGSYEFPYTTGVQAFITLLVLVPGFGFIGFTFYDRVRSTFWPTRAEAKKLRNFERAQRRGMRAFKAQLGEAEFDVLAKAERKKKKQRDEDEDDFSDDETTGSSGKRRRRRKGRRRRRRRRGGDDEDESFSETGTGSSRLRRSRSRRRARRSGDDVDSTSNSPDNASTDGGMPVSKTRDGLLDDDDDAFDDVELSVMSSSGDNRKGGGSRKKKKKKSRGMRASSSRAFSRADTESALDAPELSEVPDLSSGRKGRRKRRTRSGEGEEE